MVMNWGTSSLLRHTHIPQEESSSKAMFLEFLTVDVKPFSLSYPGASLNFDPHPDRVNVERMLGPYLWSVLAIQYNKLLTYTHKHNNP